MLTLTCSKFNCVFEQFFRFVIAKEKSSIKNRSLDRKNDRTLYFIVIVGMWGVSNSVYVLFLDIRIIPRLPDTLCCQLMSSSFCLFKRINE